MGATGAQRSGSGDATRLLDEAGPTLSVGETARVLGISRGTAYSLARSGGLGVRVIRVGRTLRVSTDSLRQLVTGNGEPAA